MAVKLVGNLNHSINEISINISVLESLVMTLVWLLEF